MIDTTDPRWPRFKIVTYTPPTGIPNGWDEELLEKGAPDGIAVEALKDLFLLDDPDVGPLICFGRYDRNDYYCLSQRTNQVMYAIYGTFNWGQSQPEFLVPTSFVSSSLGQFIASVRTITERFPYDSWQPGQDPAFSDLTEKFAYEDKFWDEWKTACQEMIIRLREIDPAAIAEPDSLWQGIMDDIEMGNFSTKTIMRERFGWCQGATDE